MIEKIIQFIAKLPSTQIRILVTVAIWAGTAIWVWTGGVPSIAFLTTITVMSGLDAVQHIGKRVTSHKPVEVAQAEMIRKNGGPYKDEDDGPG